MTSDTYYYQLFMNQFVTSIAQLTAFAITGSVAVPLYNFYAPKMNRVMSNWGSWMNETFQIEADSTTIVSKKLNGSFYMTENSSTYLDFTDVSSFVLNVEVSFNGKRALHELKGVKLNNEYWRLVVNSIRGCDLDRDQVQFIMVNNKLQIKSNVNTNLKYTGYYFDLNSDVNSDDETLCNSDVEDDVEPDVENEPDVESESEFERVEA